MSSKNSANEFLRLIDIIKTLRGPEGCDWDKAQTSESLTPYLLEEAYEVIESINDNDPQKIKEELGDLLLHIVFQAQIGHENNDFHIEDSIRHINEKLIRRHPHVFGDVNVKTTKEIAQNWEQIKMQEGRKSLMEGLPKSFPALLLARRVQERAAEVGFDWDHSDQVWEKVHEEIDELKESIAAENKKRIEDELGDLLFSVVNLSRFIDSNPDKALRGTIDKFISRFQYIEQHLQSTGKTFKEMSLSELDDLWNEAKSKNRTHQDI